jgi:hypothetical protein
MSLCVGCSKQEESKEEVIQLTCTGNQLFRTESNRVDGLNTQFKIEKTTVYKFTKRTEFVNGKDLGQWIIQDDERLYDRNKDFNTSDEHTSKQSTVEVSDEKIKYYNTQQSDSSKGDFSIDSLYDLEINRYTGEFNRRTRFIQVFKDKTYEKHFDNTKGKCEKSERKF